MVGDDKVRILVTVTKEMKKELDELAAKQIRSTSNFIVSVLTEYLNNNNNK